MKRKYRIAIPSSNRADIIQEKTLAYLAKTDITPEQIDIHIRKEDEKEYRQKLDQSTYNRLIVFDAPLGIKEARNHIAQHYLLGTYLVCIDDDIEEIKERVDKKTLETVYKLGDVIDEGFEQCQLMSCSLWGIHYCNNAYFMPYDVRVGLATIAGGFFGYVVEKKDNELVSIDDYEDIERSIKFYLKDDAVVRLDKYTTKTKTRTQKGGTQDYKNWRSLVDDGGMQDYRSLETCENGASYLAKTYPELCQYRVGKDDLPTVKLRDKRIVRKRSLL